MNDRTLAALQLAAALGAHPNRTLLPHAIARHVTDLAKLGASLQRRYAAACTYQWATTPAYAKATARLEAKATALAKELGVPLELQTDPRGMALVFTIGDQEYRL